MPEATLVINRFWTSSEAADSPESDVYKLNTLPGYRKEIYKEWKIASGEVRPCLAY